MLKYFLDVNWASDIDERKSKTSYAFSLDSGVISWESKRNLW
jgi:hypothetical protein